MPVFSYKAVDAGRNVVSGTLTADTPGAGREALRRRQLRPVEFSRVGFTRPRWSLGFVAARHGHEHVSEFARQLSLLLRTGVPVIDALDVVVREQRGRFAAILRDIRDRVVAGGTFSDALAAHPAWFGSVFCNAARVGEAAGNLDNSLRELSAYLRERQNLRAQFLTALAYPIVLAVLGTAVVIFLMSYVIPQLLTLLESSNRPLPAPTALLKGMSDFLTGNWVLLGLIALLLAAGFPMALRWPPGRRCWDTAIVRLPMLGPLIRKGLVAQFSQMLALLLRSGVPFVESVRLIRRDTRHTILADELDSMTKAVESGSDIAPTLDGSKVFPPLVVHLFSVGQATGELTEILQQLKEGYETEIRIAIARFTSALEPILIIIMSAVVGFVVFATMLPILEATRAIQ